MPKFVCRECDKDSKCTFEMCLHERTEEIEGGVRCKDCGHIAMYDDFDLPEIVEGVDSDAVG